MSFKVTVWFERQLLALDATLLHPATTLVIAVVLEIVAWFRALNVADDEQEYRKR